MNCASRIVFSRRTLALIALTGSLAVGGPTCAGDADARVATATQSASSCEEDRTAEGPPTISRPFDPKGTSDGRSAYVAARTNALQYCATQRCTRAEQTIERTAHAYALAPMKRGKLIVGVRCEPPAEASAKPAATAPGEVEYKLQQPAEIDAALAKAIAHCAPAKARAELADLQEKDGTFLAIFNCGS